MLHGKGTAAATATAAVRNVAPEHSPPFAWLEKVQDI
jgi:hypothetical protein